MRLGAIFMTLFIVNSSSSQVQFICNELLGRPTNTSVTVHACANKTLDVFYEFGTDSMSYQRQTVVQSCPDSIPFVFVLDGLSPDTRYYYRMRYRESGANDYLARGNHTFHTQRARGSSFTFAVQADPHLDTNSNPAVYALTLQNILSNGADFLIDLGDTFMSEKLHNPTQDSITYRHLLLRSYYDIVCHSIPLFLVIGNHEGELGWMLDGTSTSLPVLASNTRTNYYPNPLPGTFYSGNTKSEDYVGLRQNYYAWEWGNALFVVLDPYWYTKAKPGWGWTLGLDQYNWFKSVVTSSSARFRFVFCHQLVGGSGTDGRGGIEFAQFFENGGMNLDSTWGFDANRPGWQKTIHQLMVENKVNIFFHGHDHFYGKQDKDGVVYQEVPQPSLRSFTSNPASQYGYVNGVILPSRGYLLVTVTDTSTKVDYIRTYLPSEENGQRHNKDISATYSVSSSIGATYVRDAGTVPQTFSVNQNYPNPFNPETVIRYHVSALSPVRLSVYDLLGREIATLVDEMQPAGSYEVLWSAAQLASGLYLYRVSAGTQSITKSMMLLK